MAGLILEPYAAWQRWQLPGSRPDWQALLSAYLLRLASACQASGAPLIGHIKALALFDDGGYLRISVVDSAHPPTIEGSVPEGVTALTLSLNLILYGLERAALERLAAETAQQIAAEWGAQVDII